LKLGRNDPCPCGSGKKHKKCCQGKLELSPSAPDSVKVVAPLPAECSQLVALYNAGHHVELERRAHLLIEQYPEDGFVWKVLGAALQAQGKNALAAMEKAAKLLPNDAEAHSNLGNALTRHGQLEDAVVSYRRALKIKPDYFEAHSNLSNALKDLGQLDDALASCRRALSIKPDLAAAHNNLGNILKDLGQLDDAVASYRRALAIKPDYVEAHSNLGNVLREIGQLDDAVASYRRALAIKPDYAEAHSNLGNVLQEIGQLDDAVASYRRALAIKPDYAEAHSNLGSALKDLEQLDDAVASCRRALEIKPDYAEAHSNLGSILTNLGKLDDAVASYHRALEIKPENTIAHSNLLFCLNYHPDKSAEQIYEAYREYDVKFGLSCRNEWRPHPNNRETQRRLKVGYVSPDFRKHSTRHFLEPLLAHHDRQAVEVYAYAELTREDAATARYRSYADHWVTTVGLSDQELTERIRADGIDILVELAGHTAKNRLGVFARKPAPVSLSWLGYGSEGLFSEKLWRMAAPGYVYRPAEGMGEVSTLPAMSVGHITFGTLSRGVRINHRTIRVWSEILKRVKGARLMIDSGTFREAFTQDMLAEKFTAHGISRDRLQIGCHSPAWDVLQKLDIGLDCFPHNSGTTLFETLYMGVPFVTLAGRPSVGRIGSSILEGAAHPEWIAKTEDEYVEKAVALASDLVELAALRSRLRREMETGPLMDEAGFARKVEAAYREMFEKWAKG